MEFLICVALQIILFIPFFFIWRKDCKAIGKENLAASLTDTVRVCKSCFCGRPKIYLMATGEMTVSNIIVTVAKVG